MAEDTLGVILAGGRARRMGGRDKALLHFDGLPLIGHILEKLSPEVAAVAISANGDPARFARFGLPVLPDTVADLPGPLAGVLAGLKAAKASGHGHVLTVPADVPFLPPGLCQRLTQAATEAGTPVAAAASHGRRHTVIARWSVSLAETLADALSRGERRVGQILDEAGCAVADYGAPTPDPFFNINTPADLATARHMRRPDTG